MSKDLLFHPLTAKALSSIVALTVNKTKKAKHENA